MPHAANTRSGYARQVFVNVPFDSRYRALFRALVFSVHYCGLKVRCALEADDGGKVRLDTIYGIIKESQYGIHDLSRTTLDSTNRLPRFNMPLELGIFLGARRFGTPEQRRKSCLILDRDRYRFQIFCSDISGQDIRAHTNDVSTAIRAVRDWLRANRHQSSDLAGAGRVIDQYLLFRHDLPRICKVRGLTPSDMTFLDYRQVVDVWLETNVGIRPR